MMDCHSNKLEVLRGFRKVVPTLGSKHIRAVRDEHGTDVDGACGTESRELAVGHGFPERPNVNHGLFGDCEEKMQGVLQYARSCRDGSCDRYNYTSTEDTIPTLDTGNPSLVVAFFMILLLQSG